MSFLLLALEYISWTSDTPEALLGLSMLVGEPHLSIRLQMGTDALLLHLIVPLGLFIHRLKSTRTHEQNLHSILILREKLTQSIPPLRSTISAKISVDNGDMFFISVVVSSGRSLFAEVEELDGYVALTVLPVLGGSVSAFLSEH